jgi:hypothetical protein
MAIYCPITKTNVVYLECLECDDKVCKTGRSSRPVARPVAYKYHCNCCGTTFDEPSGIFEKLRCPSCDAVYEEGRDYIEKLEDE